MIRKYPITAVLTSSENEVKEGLWRVVTNDSGEVTKVQRRRNGKIEDLGGESGEFTNPDLTPIKEALKNQNVPVTGDTVEEIANGINSNLQLGIAEPMLRSIGYEDEDDILGLKIWLAKNPSDAGTLLNAGFSKALTSFNKNEAYTSTDFTYNSGVLSDSALWPKKRVTSIPSYFAYNNNNLINIPKLTIESKLELGSAFRSCPNLTALVLDRSENITKIQYFASGCTSLKIVKGLDLSGITNKNLEYIFGSCSLRVLPVLNTENMQSMPHMINNMANLEMIPYMSARGYNKDHYRTYITNAKTSNPKLKYMLVEGIGQPGFGSSYGWSGWREWRMWDTESLGLSQVGIGSEKARMGIVHSLRDLSYDRLGHIKDTGEELDLLCVIVSLELVDSLTQQEKEDIQLRGIDLVVQ